eukprot:COSAG02_NODE_364_length_23758_cov_17.250011_4_plen_406_part_00
MYPRARAGVRYIRSRVVPSARGVPGAPRLAGRPLRNMARYPIVAAAGAALMLLAAPRATSAARTPDLRRTSHDTAGDPAGVAAAAETLHVNAAAALQSRHQRGPALRADGSRENPYSSLQAAKEHIIRQHRARRDGSASGSSIRHVQIHAGQYAPIAIDHPALSGIHWRGAGRDLTAVSGGKEIPRARFEPWPKVPGAFVASIAGLDADDLGSMVSGNEVADCQSDKVGLSYGGEAMVNARWPNQPEAVDETAPWAWSRAVSGCNSSSVGGSHSTFALDVNDDPDALRLLKWRAEAEGYVHGYWEWDWGDSYAPISNIWRQGGVVELSYFSAPTCKPGARWMGVNLCTFHQAPCSHMSTALWLLAECPIVRHVAGVASVRARCTTRVLRRCKELPRVLFPTPTAV